MHTFHILKDDDPLSCLNGFMAQARRIEKQFKKQPDKAHVAENEEESGRNG